MVLYFNNGMCSVQQKTSKNNFNVAAEAGRLYLKARGSHKGKIIFLKDVIIFQQRYV